MIAAQATIRRLQLWSSLLAIVVLLLHLALESARLAGNYAGMFDPALQALVLGTSGARTHAVQVIGLAAIALGTMGAGKGLSRGRWGGRSRCRGGFPDDRTHQHT